MSFKGTITVQFLKTVVAVFFLFQIMKHLDFVRTIKCQPQPSFCVYTQSITSLLTKAIQATQKFPISIQNMETQITVICYNNLTRRVCH